MQVYSKSSVQIAVSATKALIPLSSHVTDSSFHLLSLYRLGFETWVERETVNGGLRAGLKPSRFFVLCQKRVVGKKFLVSVWIDLAIKTVEQSVELHSLGPGYRRRQIRCG